MDNGLNQLAKKIISENEYLTLATVDESRKPWVSILAYTVDDKYNFYFCSLPTSRHSKHIKQASSVAFSIYDSRQNFGYGVGLQIEGNLEEAKDDEYVFIEKIYLGRKYPYGNVDNNFMNGLKKLLDDRVYRFYKISVTQCWINDPNVDTDRSVVVDLRESINI